MAECTHTMTRPTLTSLDCWATDLTASPRQDWLPTHPRCALRCSAATPVQPVLEYAQPCQAVKVRLIEPHLMPRLPHEYKCRGRVVTVDQFDMITRLTSRQYQGALLGLLSRTTILVVAV